MSKKTKIFALVVLGLAAIVGAFSMFGGGGSSSTTTPPSAMPSGAGGSLSTSAMPTSGSFIPGGPVAIPTPGMTNAAANEFSGLLSSINSITIDTSIFENPAYKALRDYPILLGTDTIGRINPFAPIGTDGVAPTVTIVAVQTLAAGKVTTTTAELGALVTLPDTTPASTVFQYGISDTFGTATSPLTVTKTGTVLVTISGLAPGTKYFVQAVAVRGSVTTTGNTMTFTTNSSTAMSPL